MQMTFTCVAEEWPDSKWKALFDLHWPAYQRWYLSEGIDKRPTYRECWKKLEYYMPEFLPLYERLCDLSGGSDIVARFLSLYRPPPYISGCSQAVWVGKEPMLVRNYDYSPALCEGVMTSTRWFDRRVIAMSDCLWGALDGVNDAGLVASLTFGGRKVVGDGFGMPIVLRYLLETCETTEEASKLLHRIPVHMSYNVTVLDKSCNFITAYVNPDRETIIQKKPVATNYQTKIEWQHYAAVTATEERESFLFSQLYEPGMTADRLLAGFFKPPLYKTGYEQGFGTLYTTAYWPNSLKAGLFWPKGNMIQTFDDFSDSKCCLQF